VHYSDPNYLGSTEFSSYNDIVTDPVAEIEQVQDMDTITDNYYLDHNVANNYHDYSFSSRLRRFHRPMYYSNYYGGLYTDYYWYNNDPFYCGTSIYYGYNWNSPYYSYSPYYYNNYNSHFAYGHNNYLHNTPNYTYYNSTNNYTTGHRGSLSSHSNGRGVKKNTITPNTNVKTSIVNIRNRNTFKNNIGSTNRNTTTTTTTKPYTGIKTSTNKNNTTTKTNENYRGNTSNKTSTKKRNNSYTAPKSNSNNRNYNSGKSKSSSGNRSSGGSNRRSTKPRK
tara:strand:- start:99 stop:935 length:837 start_codon:yes stop_codon:yes gene_type:complete